MANEIEFTFELGQNNIWFSIFKDDNGTIKVYVTNTGTWEVWQNSNILNYYIAMKDTGGGLYTGNFPAISTGIYTINIYQDTDDPSIGTTNPIGSEGVYWNGTEVTTYLVISPTGMDLILTTEPSGRASTFREMLIQLYMRFFNKTTLDTTTLTVYDEDGSAITTQTVSDDGTTKTANKAT